MPADDVEKNKRTKVITAALIAAALLLLVLIAVFALPAATPPVKTAATATYDDHGTELSVEVTEDEVEKRIAEEREANKATDDESWHRWLEEEFKDETSFKKETLQKMLVEKMVEKVAANNGVEITDADIDAEIERICSQMGIDPSDFEAYVAAMGYASADEYRKDLKNQLFKKRLVESGLAKKAWETSDEDILYWINDSGIADMTSYDIDCIAIEKDSPALEEIVSAADADFDSAREKYSSTTQYDGIIGMTCELTDPAVMDAAYALSPGQTSNVIDGGAYLFIVRLNGVYTKPEGGYSSLDDVPEPLLSACKKEISHFEDEQSIETFELTIANGLSYTIKD